jgi:hypothetical protein
MKVTKKDLHTKIKLVRLITKVMTRDVTADNYLDLIGHIRDARLVIDGLEYYVKEKLNEVYQVERIA